MASVAVCRIAVQRLGLPQRTLFGKAGRTLAVARRVVLELMDLVRGPKAVEVMPLLPRLATEMVRWSVVVDPW